MIDREQYVPGPASPAHLREWAPTTPMGAWVRLELR